jgi:hypothetical protein
MVFLSALGWRKDTFEKQITINTKGNTMADDDKFWKGESASAHGEAAAKLDIFVGAKAEVVVGGSASIKLAESLDALAGASQILRLAHVLSATLGRSDTGQLGPQKSFGTTKTKALAQERRLTLMREDIDAHTNEISSVSNRVALEERAATVTVSAIAGLRRNLAGECSKVHALETRCSAEKMEALAASCDTAAESIRSVASRVETVASEVTLVAEETRALASRVEIVEQTSTVAASIIML